jgi:hypothetical protein
MIIQEMANAWSFEVNASPSLTANTVADYEMKYGLLDDLLTACGCIDVGRQVMW